MHDLEPHFTWRGLYRAEDDERSPFYGREYSEFHFTHAVYDHYIHPQWDEFGSSTLYGKILYADYHNEFAIIELIGEWNDILHNDIMHLKREVLDVLLDEGIRNFIILGENVMNAFPNEDDYYAEWYEDTEDGFIAFVNFREHVIREFRQYGIGNYVHWGGELDELAWRPLKPEALFKKISDIVHRRLG